MFIASIGKAIPEKRVNLGPDFLRTKGHFEEETAVSYYVASPDDTPFTLAASAAEDALRESTVPASEIDAVIYVNALMKDYASWSLSAALCNHLGIPKAMFLDIYQGCNGLAGVDIAVNMLKARPDMQRILVATSQVLPPLLGSHKTIDRGSIISDGAAAMIIDRNMGDFEIVQLALGYNATVNDIAKVPYGGTEVLKETDVVSAVDGEAMKAAYIEAQQVDIEVQFFMPIAEIVAKTLRDASVAASDVSFVAMPNYCRLFNGWTAQIFPHIPQSNTSVELAMQHSHMGAADAWINLQAMSANIMATSGMAFVFQSGMGYSVGGMLVRPVG